jgi:coenzyme F420-0:L-glutamate ligase / coenzyme F420-1:gamma-L-glutamate ligase
MSAPAQPLQIFPIPLADEILAGDSIAARLLRSLRQHKLALRPGDILVVKHKIVSKAEGAVVELATIQASAASRVWARRYHLEAPVIELAMVQSRRTIRRRRGVLITETRHGFVCANSGIDVSNVNGGRHALLLPEDPDRSAARLRRELSQRLHLLIPVIISDSFGRPWRVGTVGVAIGCAGFPATLDLRGQPDLFGRPLRVTVVGHADEIASAASVLMGQGREARPVILVRGIALQSPAQPAAALIRPQQQDLFR